MNYAADEALNREQKALDIIGDFADRMCQTVKTEGSSSEADLSGSGKANLAKVITGVADLGFKGSQAVELTYLADSSGGQEGVYGDVDSWNLRIEVSSFHP